VSSLIALNLLRCCCKASLFVFWCAVCVCVAVVATIVFLRCSSLSFCAFEHVCADTDPVLCCLAVNVLTPGPAPAPALPPAPSRAAAAQLKRQRHYWHATNSVELLKFPLALPRHLRCSESDVSVGDAPLLVLLSCSHTMSSNRLHTHSARTHDAHAHAQAHTTAQTSSHAPTRHAITTSTHVAQLERNKL